MLNSFEIPLWQAIAIAPNENAKYLASPQSGNLREWVQTRLAKNVFTRIAHLVINNQYVSFLSILTAPVSIELHPECYSQGQELVPGPLALLRHEHDWQRSGSLVSDGVHAAVVSRHPDMIFLPIETSGEGEINAYSRVQMTLAEAKVLAHAAFDRALSSTGRPLGDIRAFVAGHATLRHPFYPIPRRQGVAGVAANFVLHVGDLMAGRTRPHLRDEAGAGMPAWATPGGRAAP